MHVLIVEPVGRAAGAEPMYTIFLSNALANEGAEITVVTFDGLAGDLGQNDRIEHISFCAKVGPFAPPLRLLERLLNLKKLLALDSYLDTFLTFILVSREAKKQKYDAIHVLDVHPFMAPRLLLAASLSDYTLVSNINFPCYRHGLKDWLKRLGHSLTSRDIRLGRHLLMNKASELPFVVGMEKLLYRRVSKRNHLAFVCHSQEVQESYEGSFFCDQTAYIPWGIHNMAPTSTRYQARQHLNLAQEETILLSFGVNHRQKNLEVIFQAVENLPKDFKILHAGKIDHDLVRNDPEELAESYGWSENTIIRDEFIPEDEMQHYFLAADAILLSYTTEFLHASGVLSHAAGFNLPVIASTVGQLGKFVETHRLGLTFVPEDAQSLQQAIVSFLNLSEEDKAAMEESLRAFAASYSWEAVARKHLDLYRSLSGQASHEI